MTAIRGYMNTNVAKGHLAYKGDRGYSNYEIAVKNGYQGTEQDWIDHFGLDLSGYLKTTDVVDNLTSSTITTYPLSAKQGYVLNTAVSTKVNTADIVDGLTSTSATVPLSAKQGKVLKDSLDTTDGKIGTLSSLHTTAKTNLVAAVNEVADAIEDTGWIDITLSSGTTTGIYGGKPQYRKIGDHVFLRGGIAFTKGSSTYTASTLPSEIMPSNPIYRMVATGGTRIARIGISPVGALFVDWIYLLNGTSAFTGEVSWLIIDCDYFLDEEE